MKNSPVGLAKASQPGSRRNFCRSTVPFAIHDAHPENPKRRILLRRSVAAMIQPIDVRGTLLVQKHTPDIVWSYELSYILCRQPDDAKHKNESSTASYRSILEIESGAALAFQWALYPSLNSLQYLSRDDHETSIYRPDSPAN